MQSLRRRVWATRFFENSVPDAFDAHFFNGLLKQVFSIPQSVSKRCASTVNADEITKHIDGSIQQPTLARLYFSIPFVPTRVVLRIACWYLRLVTRRAVIPMSHCLCGLRATAFAGWLEWHKSKGKLSVTDTVTQQ